MKTAEELKDLKEEVETLNSKLRELTTDELAQVTGGYVEPGEWPEYISPWIKHEVHHI